MKFFVFIFIIVLAGCGTVDSVKQAEQASSFTFDLFGLSYYDSRFHFIKVELPSKKIVVLNSSDSIQIGTTDEAALNTDANEYYFFSDHRIFVLSTATGQFTKSFGLTHDVELLVYNPVSKKLNAMSYVDGSYHFVEIDVQAEKVKTGPAFENLFTVNEGSASINAASSLYFFASPENGIRLHAIDTKSGIILKSYDTLNTVGARGVVSLSDTTLFGMSSFARSNRFFNYNTALHKIRMLAPSTGKMIEYTNKTIVDGVYFYASDYNTFNCVDVETGATILSIAFQNSVYDLIPVRRK